MSCAAIVSIGRAVQRETLASVAAADYYAMFAFPSFGVLEMGRVYDVATKGFLICR